MADKNITALTAASTLDGTELAIVTQGGNSRKSTIKRFVEEVVHALTGKTTPVDADEMMITDSAASFVGKKVTLTNFKAFLKTYFDGLYTSGTGTGVTTSRSIISGAGLTGGGDLSADRTLAVGAGTGVTVNADDVAVNISGLTADGSPDGAADYVMTYDNSATTLKKVLLNNLPTASGSVSTSRTITSGAGLTGGGDLSADRTLAVGAGTGISVNADDVQIASAYQSIGVQTIWVPAGAMVADTVNGPSAGAVQPSSHGVIFPTLDFDTSTQEYAQFQIRMPKGWNEGTVTFVPTWSHPSTSTNFGVVWKLDGVACSDDDAGDASFGTGQTSTDTGGTTNDIYIGPASSAITIAGTPAAEDLVTFRIYRVPSDGSDTLAVDARLHGVTVYYTIDAANDA